MKWAWAIFVTVLILYGWAWIEHTWLGIPHPWLSTLLGGRVTP